MSLRRLHCRCEESLTPRYRAGLSGGGWLVSSIMLNNYSTVVQLRDGFEGTSVFQFSNSILKGPKERGLSALNTASYWDDIIDQVQEKRKAGYNTSLTDLYVVSQLPHMCSHLILTLCATTAGVAH
jgi:hypothetical protein